MDVRLKFGVFSVSKGFDHLMGERDCALCMETNMYFWKFYKALTTHLVAVNRNCAKSRIGQEFRNEFG